MHDADPDTKFRPLRVLLAALTLVLVLVLALAVGGGQALPIVGDWLADVYTRLAEGRPATLDVTLLLALLAVALIIGRRARQR